MGIVEADVGNMPLISVVMSVYNDDQKLPAAIQSILDQTYKKIEFIIVDDGSLDNSLDIIQEFANQDSRIEAVSRENKGLAISLNEAMQLAKGQYIARMDSDDIAFPNRLQVQIDYLLSHPEIDILGGQAKVIDERGTVTRDIQKPISSQGIHQYLGYASPLIHPTYLVKRIVYRELGGYRKFKVAQDFDFLLRAEEAGYRLGNVSDYVLLYRENKSGLSAKNALRQMRAGRLLLKLRRFRAAGKPEPRTILSRLKSHNENTSQWFDILWRSRNSAIVRSKILTGIQKRFCLLWVILISLMHYELFFSSYRVWRSTRWKTD